jgi:hypothetical protein
VGFTIDAQRQTADDDPSIGCQLPGDGPGDSKAPRSSPAGPDYGNGGFIQDARSALNMDFRRWIIDLAPKFWPVGMIRLEMVFFRVRKAHAGSGCGQLIIPAWEDVQSVFNQHFP